MEKNFSRKKCAKWNFVIHHCNHRHGYLYMKLLLSFLWLFECWIRNLFLATCLNIAITIAFVHSNIRTFYPNPPELCWDLNSFPPANVVHKKFQTIPKPLHSADWRLQWHVDSADDETLATLHIPNNPDWMLDNSNVLSYLVDLLFHQSVRKICTRLHLFHIRYTLYTDAFRANCITITIHTHFSALYLLFCILREERRNLSLNTNVFLQYFSFLSSSFSFFGLSRVLWASFLWKLHWECNEIREQNKSETKPTKILYEWNGECITQWDSLYHYVMILSLVLSLSIPLFQNSKNLLYFLFHPNLIWNRIS